MKIQKILLVLSLFSSVALADMSDALENSTPEQRAELQTRFMTEQLKISGSTATKVQAINLKYAQKMQPVIKGTDSQLSKMMKIKGLMADKDQELAAAMTPEQFQSYEGLKDDLKAYLESHLQK